jgi:hypothetical protein
MNAAALTPRAPRMRMPSWPSWPPALLLAAAPGCGPDAEDVVAVGVSVDAGSPATSEGGAAAVSCAGPALGCRADFAAVAFTQAVCSCGDVSVHGVFSTDVVGSASAAATASVGVDGALTDAQFVRAGGDLVLAGTSPAVIGGVQTSGDFHIAAGGVVGGALAVAGNAWFGADLTSTGVVSIGGDLHLAPGATLSALVPAIVGGATSTSAFATEAPCLCGAEPPIDVAGVLAAASSTNDDARLSVPADALAGASATHEWQWSCATIAVDSVGGAGPLRIDVSGKVALFVQGDVDLPASFVLALAPGAELDWYIGGHFAIAAGARVGDVTRPGAVRVYVLGSAGVALPGDTTVGLSLYAPSAAVTVGGLGYANGAVFAASVSAPLGLIVHDDPLAAAEVCPDD